jgi:PAB1-binding protein PBP1
LKKFAPAGGYEVPNLEELALNIVLSRSWDQFETNKTLFGVESTFNEELYTTKLERGPQTREREREAWRIAREIEGQTTRNVHLAEVISSISSQRTAAHLCEMLLGCTSICF